MARRNIYIPEPLDEEVKRLKLPISELCQDALLVAVRHRRAEAMSDGDLAATASRLLADREASERAQYQDGFAVGRDWAQRDARWNELARFEPHRGRPRDLVLLDPDHSLRNALFSWGISREYDVQEDWFRTLDRDEPFGRGVIDGATSVLVAVLPIVENRQVDDE